MEQIFSETFKLIHITVTIPMSLVEAERLFSTLKTIETCFRNTMVEKWLNTLTILSVEKNGESNNNL